ncbi:MAG: AMIN domain-containing protein [Gemmatimonadota bacterium]
MTALIAFLAALLAPPLAHDLPAVRGLGVVPGSGSTEVVIAVDGAITATDFQLGSPARIVIDMAGTAEKRDYTGINRGGVRSLRVAQFDNATVRVVIDLDGPVSYRVSHAPGQVRVSFPHEGASFEPWTTGDVEDILAATVREAAAAVPPAAAADLRLDTERERANAPATVPLTAPLLLQDPQEPQELRIEIEFVQRSVADIANVLMDIVDRTIVVASDVRDRVITAQIRGDLPWRQAFESILRANDMALLEDQNNILQIVSAESAAQRAQVAENLETRTFEMKYQSVDSLAPQIRQMVSDTGSVAVVTASNALVVTDFPSRLARIANVIESLDVPAIQVGIKASITFVDRTALENLGVIYDLKDSQGNQLNELVGGFRDANNNGVLEPDEATDQSVVLLGGNSIAALGNAAARAAGSPLEVVTSLVLGRHTLITFLQALQDLSLSDIQAEPMVTVMNHRLANIQVGERTPVRVADYGAAGGGGEGAQAPRATVQFENTGVILRVTPHVTGDNVRMVIHAERSNIALAPGDLGITFATQLADTEVTVRDGETVVIAGLTIEEESRIRQGIPILMDLPVIGALFRNTTERVNKRDLIITVTPYIIPED